jgi:hypothetical protein
MTTDFDEGYKDGRASYDQKPLRLPYGHSAEYIRGYADGRKAGPGGTVVVDGVTVPRTMEPS